jgi:hypothetical protein
VLTAGHWGDEFDRYTVQNVSHDHSAPWRMASEMIVEKVRAIEFPYRPSRLNCCFAWLDEVTARNSIALTPAWCVEVADVVNLGAKRFVADFELMSSRTRFRVDVPFLPMTVEIARRYWTGAQVQVPEMLIESDLRIAGVLSRPEQR